METFKLFICAIILASMFGCVAGTTQVKLTGGESALPPELKGLRVYNISTGGLGEIKVALLDGQIRGTSYAEGKTTEYTVIITNNNNNRTFNSSQIITETDDLIIIKK